LEPEVVWHCDPDVDKVYELSPADLSVIRSAGSPDPTPLGIGGSFNVIWFWGHTNFKLYELSTADFSVIRSGAAGYGTPRGVGGSPTVIWMSDDYNKRLLEISEVDFSIARIGDIGGTQLKGWGGKDDLILVWRVSGGVGRLEKRNPADFSAIAAKEYATQYGAGGDTEIVWAAGAYQKVYKIATADLSLILETTSPGSNPYGMGGEGRV